LSEAGRQENRGAQMHAPEQPFGIHDRYPISYFFMGSSGHPVSRAESAPKTNKAASVDRCCVDPLAARQALRSRIALAP
jgi:hypothetical protein